MSQQAEFSPYLATSAKSQSRHAREKQAKAFFDHAFPELNEAIERGMLRWQFTQPHPVTFHDTDYGKAFARRLEGLGYAVRWVPRTFDAMHRANPFGQITTIYELRAWWHDGHEELPSAGQAVAEGSHAQDHQQATKTGAQKLFTASHEQQPKESEEGRQRRIRDQEAYRLQMIEHRKELARQKRTLGEILSGSAKF